MTRLMDLRERIEDFDEVLETIKDAVRSQVRTAVPVSVAKDSEDGHTLSLQPLVKANVRMPDGTVKAVQLPQLDKIPIHHAGGGGQTTTISHKKGDEGVILVSDTGIDVWHQQGGVQAAGDTRMHALSDAVYVPGLRSDPRKIPDYNTEATENRSDDGKNRTIHHPKNGTKVSNNGGKQVLDVNAVSGAIEGFSKTLTFGAGDAPSGGKPNTATTTARDLNDALKGLSARVGQVEKTAHALFDVTSKLREIAQMQIPALAVLAPILNQQPGGLDAMVGAIEGKAQAYLQTQMQQALGMFLNPTLGAITSLLSGNLEGLIQALTAQLANLAAANPVIAQVDGLQRQIDGILARSASPEIQAAGIGPLQAQIDVLTKDNPIIGQVAGLKNQLQGLLGQAGAGAGFLDPQQRLVKGVIKSMHFSEG